jgi:hypothetical protein
VPRLSNDRKVVQVLEQFTEQVAAG